MRHDALRAASAAFVLLLGAPATAGDLSDFDWAAGSAAVDAIFADLAKDVTPGCAVGVIHDGAFVHTAGYGMANLEHGIPLTADSIFRTGSVSKQFTAMAIAILAERGDLDLDADIHTYLPELIDYRQKVTIRQMVHHVAGMGDYENVKTYFQNANGGAFRWGNQDYLTISEFYKSIARVPLALPAGTKYQYSNYAYFLLSQVVERVSGKTLRRFADKEIFGRLGMTKSLFNDNVNGIVPRRADGYRAKKGGGFEIFMTNLSWVGDGGVYTSINDFLKWDQNFYDNKLGAGGNELMQLVQTPHPVQPSADTGYGFGMSIGSYNGHRQISHGGSWVAFTTYYARYPDLGFSVVTFCNSIPNNAADRARQVIEVYLGPEPK